MPWYVKCSLNAWWLITVLIITLIADSWKLDTGYPHDGRADKDSYLHDGRADKDSYPHDGRADKDSYPHDRHKQCIMLSL